MTIKAGDLLHVGNGTVVIDRVQSGGATVNVPQERINELGNYQSVATVRDIPDLSFTAESLDVSTEFERLLLANVATPSAGDSLQLSKCVPLNVAGLIKAGRDATDPTAVAMGIGLPGLYLERMEYRFGLRDFARQTATMRGDFISYNPGSVYVEQAAGTGAAGQTVVTANPAFIFNGDPNTGPRRIQAIDVSGKRLVYGRDWTESYGAVSGGAAVTTVTILAAVPASKNIRLMYGSPAVAHYAQSANNDGVTGALVKPAAIRGRDIDIYINDSGSQDPANKWSGVQQASVDWRVNLDRDEEFGNSRLVGADFVQPDTSGSVDIKPVDTADFLSKLRTIANIGTTTESIGAQTSVPLALDIVLKDPETGSPVKTLYVPDARITLPGYNGRVLQKLVVQMPFAGDSGELYVIEGTR